MTKSAKGTVENPGTNVAQKTGLNRSLQRFGLAELVTRIEQKTAYFGGTLIKVNARNTSRKCNVCGHTEKGNRKSQVKFECLECGHIDNADRNAALNILMLGLKVKNQSK